LLLPRGDFDKNNLFVKEKHRLTLWPNYFTELTLLCGILAIGATPLCVAPMRTAPHIHADVARSTLRAVDQPMWQDMWCRSHQRHTFPAQPDPSEWILANKRGGEWSLCNFYPFSIFSAVRK
jgi:hypothetical protein